MTPLRSAGAVVAAAALALGGLAIAAPAAQAATDPRPASIGADWLAAQAHSGLQQSSFGGPDVGLTIDSADALAAVGGHGSDITATTTAIGPQLVKTGSGNFGYAESDEYTFDPNGGPGTFIQKGYYASGIAKALNYAETTGAVSNIPAWAGTDLVADLESLVVASGPSTGRLEDNSSYGDFANVLSQAYGVSALIRAGSPKQNAAVDFLLQQQCPAGYFRLYFNPDPAASDQTCEAGLAAGQSAADSDATSEVVRLLIPFANSDVTLARRVGKAEAWLLGQQHADGSFGGGTSTAASNANSTGLAGWVLGLLGDDAAATRAGQWIRQHQADEVAGCTDALSAEAGAIGYDDAVVSAALKSGSIGAARPTWVRATSQAIPVLSMLQTTTAAIAVTAPTGYVQAGRAVTVHVSGAVPGEKLCLTGAGAPVRAAADADGDATIQATLAAGTAQRTLTVTNRDGAHGQAVVKALAAKVFAVHLSRLRPHRGTLVRVSVTGLAAGEALRLTFRGVTLRTAHATATGTYGTTFNVRRTLGRGTVAVTGQFPDRHGKAVLTVIR